MANISASFSDFSSTAASNQPDQADSATVGADLRQLTATLKSVLEPLSTVAGTNTITAACAGLTAYYTGAYEFTPANTNTGATTLNINSIGAKNIFWNGAACVGGELRQNIPVRLVYDGTQFHVISSGFNAPFLDTHPVVQGSADSTKKVRFEVDGLTTATTRVVTVPDADFTIAKTTDIPSAAAQADQETATSTTTYVSPGRQQFHPSAIKAAVRFNAAGTIAYNYNITSVTDSGVGDWTVVIATDFSGAANYASAVLIGYTNPGSIRGLVANIGTASAAGSQRIFTFDAVDGVTQRDPNGVDEVHVIFTGDQ